MPEGHFRDTNEADKWGLRKYNIYKCTAKGVEPEYMPRTLGIPTARKKSSLRGYAGLQDSVREEIDDAMDDLVQHLRKGDYDWVIYPKSGKVSGMRTDLDISERVA